MFFFFFIKFPLQQLAQPFTVSDTLQNSVNRFPEILDDYCMKFAQISVLYDNISNNVDEIEGIENSGGSVG